MNRRYEVMIHHIMSIVGGFLGAYAIIARCNNFGSSETTNMIMIITNMFDKNYEMSIYRILALIIYVSGLSLTVLVPKVCKRDVRFISVMIDILGMIVLAFIPKDMNPIIALFPIFFMSAFQYNAFPRAKGYNCATIFSTNNLRQAVVGMTEYIASKDEKALDKGSFYGKTLGFYHIGVVYAYVAVVWLGLKGILLGIIPLMVVTWMILKDKCV